MSDNKIKRILTCVLLLISLSSFAQTSRCCCCCQYSTGLTREQWREMNQDRGDRRIIQTIQALEERTVALEKFNRLMEKKIMLERRQLRRSAETLQYIKTIQARRASFNQDSVQVVGKEKKFIKP